MYRHLAPFSLAMKATLLVLLGFPGGTVLSGQAFDALSTRPVDCSSVKVESSNDAFAPIPGIEWDDHDSYGFKGTFNLHGGFGVSAGIDGITARTAQASTSSRIDRAELFVSSWFRPIAFQDAYLDFGTAVGIDAIGDFGFSHIQTGWHSRAGIARPVPETYDSVNRLAPTLCAVARFSLDSPFSPFVSLATQGIGIESIDALAAAGFAYQGLGVACGDQFSASSTASAALATLENAETGFFYQLDYTTGMLFFSFNSHPINRISEGSMGFIFGKTPRHSNLGLELGVRLGQTPSPSFQFSTALPHAGPIIPLAYLGIAGGWIGNTAEGPNAPRFEEYSAGLCLDRAFMRQVLHVRMGIESGISVEELRTLTVATSQVVDSRTILDGSIVGELRASILSFVSPESGVGFKIRYSPLTLQLIKSATSFATLPPVEMGLFMYSGST